MSQLYWNEPSRGYAMTAEEFAAGACRQADHQSGCDRDRDCGCEDCGCCQDQDCCHDRDCCQPMVCCCRPVQGHKPKPPHVEEGCCCKQSFRAALGLLCDERISSLLDFDAAAFVTETYTAGAALKGGKPHGRAAAVQADDEEEGCGSGSRGKPTPPPKPCPCPGGQSDNLGTLSGSFRRFAPCTCDLLDIDAQLYTQGSKSCGFTASQVNLCELDAVVIQGAEACPEGDLTADEVAARNFRCLRQMLAQRLNPCGDPCSPECCSCACDGRDCCCAAGLLATLAQNNLRRRVSLAAGLLLLQNVQLLGSVGNVLVLANETDKRLYFVCVNSVQFIG